jgi:hypothetical protein
MTKRVAVECCEPQTSYYDTIEPSAPPVFAITFATVSLSEATLAANRIDPTKRAQVTAALEEFALQLAQSIVV